MRFNDILGHEKTLEIVSAYIDKGCFSGGYIFSGAEGIGKKAAAIAIAGKLNCTSAGERPCGTCGSCLKMEKLQHPDLHIIASESSQIKIEDIRFLQREANFRPYEGAMKVFIIDDAHKLNPEAANSLLKVLEEPPRDSLIILVTHKPQSIIKTILSRCKVIRFSPLSFSLMEGILAERYALDREAAHFLVSYSEGRLGAAIRLKDSGMVEEKNRIFDSFLASGSPLERSPAGQNKEYLRTCLNVLASCFRDVYLLKAGMPESSLIHLDRRGDLHRLAQKFSFKHLDGIISAISDDLLYLDNNINTKLILHNLGAHLWKD
jgi:DNA polymerase-3 subunit delta'